MAQDGKIKHKPVNVAPPVSVCFLSAMKSINNEYHSVLAGSSQSREGENTVSANDMKAVLQHDAMAATNRHGSYCTGCLGV